MQTGKPPKLVCEHARIERNAFGVLLDQLLIRLSDSSADIISCVWQENTYGVIKPVKNNTTQNLF